MRLPAIQFNMRFLLAVMLAIALVGGAAKVLSISLPLLGAFPLSIGFSSHIIVLFVGLGTSFSRMKTAPTVYRRSAAGCAVILLSYAPSYLFYVVLYFLNAIQIGEMTEDWRLTAFAWLNAFEHLMWAAGLVLLLSAVQYRGEQVAANGLSTR